MLNDNQNLTKNQVKKINPDLNEEKERLGQQPNALAIFKKTKEKFSDRVKSYLKKDFEAHWLDDPESFPSSFYSIPIKYELFAKSYLEKGNVKFSLQPICDPYFDKDETGKKIDRLEQVKNFKLRESMDQTSYFFALLKDFNELFGLKITKNDIKTNSDSVRAIDDGDNQRHKDCLKIVKDSLEKAAEKSEDLSSISGKIQKVSTGDIELPDNEFLMEQAKSLKTTAAIEDVCLRIAGLRKRGDLIEADMLTAQVKKEVKDFGVTASTIDELIKKAYKAYPENSEKQTKHNFPFDILGFNKERKILLWHKGHLMHFPILSLQNELKLLLGPDSVLDATVNEVISMAHQKNIVDEEESIKIGIWQLKEWRKEGKIIILSGRGGVFFKDGKYTTLEGPVVDDQIVKFEKRSWIDLEALTSATPDLKQAFQDTREILAQWPWKNSDIADWITAFVMLLPFQQLMRWRPWLWLDGASNSGKSAFFDEFLEPMYTHLIKRADKATAHSIMQGVGCSSKIPILDEFEKYKHNDEVLNMCKLMNRGGAKPSGTPGEKELIFTLHHIPIFGSIYLPRTLINDQSKRNRIIRFSLNKIQKGKRKKTIYDEKAHQLGLDIVASILPIWSEIEAKSKLIQNKTEEIVTSFKEELSSRAVENFMYASALLEIVTGEPHTVPKWARQEQIDDGRTIIEAIIRTKVRSDFGEFLVVDLICCVANEGKGEENSNESGVTAATAKKILRLNGLSIVNSKKNNIRKLAVQPDMVSKEILKGDSDFKGQDISEPLLRIDGSERVRASLGGDKMWTVQVPICVVLPNEEVSCDE